MARKILLADDSVTAQNMGRKILADAGYEVIAVNNGSAALKKIAELKPELVILDVYMPGYSGLEVCQRLKESPETARIPVLLTVGKLEPFKPEEAQRVRAEGYIVKPFEASELLSVLSKLEDKVVPRPEPSKSGRFARAMAAADELGRGSSAEPSSSETGWKSRIAFPHQKTESEQKEAERLEEQPSTYNPVNRDLRTVVEKFEETTEAKKKEEDQPAPGLDVAALAQAGLPKDVSPEELAAITAAAAQLQMAGAVEPQAIERNSSASEKTSQESYASQGSPAVSQPPVVEIIHRRRKDDRPLEETQKETRQDEAEVEAVTMAIASEAAVAPRSGASRWTAVSVALEGDEAAISLEHEMQKAYAATTDSGAVTSMPAADAAPIENFSAPSMPVGAPVEEVSSPESESVAQAETVPDTHAAEVNLVPVAQSEPPAEASSFVAAEPVNYQPVAANEQSEAVVVEPVASDVEPSQEHSEVSAAVEPTSQLQDSTASAVDNNVAEAEAPVSPLWDSTEAKAESVTSSSNAFAPIDRQPQPEPEAEPQLDPEAVKSTAAAWASWRQIRDTSKESEAAESQPTDSNAPDSIPGEMIAKAVAAGAEQIDHPAAAADPDRNPADVASIVDSVLAGLRPKLMEEISRKMAEKK